MAKKTYVVGKGVSFTSMGHIYITGEEISETVFSDKVYFQKMISEGKILEIKKTEEAPAETPAEEKVEEPAETPAEEKVEEPAETPAEEKAEEPATKRSTAKGGK